MTIRSRHPRLALFALLISGCTVNSLLNQIENQGDKAVEIACECDNLFPDQAACEAQFSSYFDFADRECLEDAMAQDKKGSKKTLKCTLDRAKRYNDCLGDKLVCTDPDSFQGCQSIWAEECPEFPPSVQVAASVCPFLD